MRALSASVVALIAVLPVNVLAQPAIGGATIRPDGPGRYVVENSLGQLSAWQLKKRADGGFDFVPSPFGKPKQSR